MAEEGSKLEYQAHVDSKLLKDDANITISEEGLTFAALFDPAFIGFADMVSFEQLNFTVIIKTDDDNAVISNLGNNFEAFYLELYEAFNNKVRSALFIKGEPGFTAEGEFRYTEGDFTAQGKGQIQVYDDCICLLPPNDNGRRIPFAFMSGLQRGDFELTLSLQGGEQYSFIRLGQNSDPFEAFVKQKLQTYRENSIEAARALDNGLSPASLAAIAGKMPEGVAAPVGVLQKIAPSYVGALEAKIGESRAAETYQVFKKICDPAQISVGMKSQLAGEEEENILWFIAPSPDAKKAAVELALDEENAAATFVYNINGDQENFKLRLNQSMEAIDFKREVISMKEDNLRSVENSNYYMAVKRTASLRFIRKNFNGRIIHSSPESWEKEIRKQFGLS